MKKKLVVSLLSLSMALAMLVGCGSSSSDTGIAESNAEETQTMVETAVESTIETTEAANGETGSAKEAKEPSYIEHDSYYEDENFDWSGNTVFTTYDNDHDIKFTSANNSAYAIYDSIDLYATNGKVMGYTKENIWCFLTATADDWYCLTIDDNAFFVKASDFEGNNALLNGSNMDYDGNYIIPDRSSTTTSSDTTSTNSNTTSNEVATSKETNNTTSNTTTNETSTNVSNETTTTSEVETSSTTSSASNDKYTPEEAVAVWRSILEANGMTWDPSIKDWASWGTGWLELKKGKPEEAAQMDLKGYAYGDGAGNSSTRYYIEVTGYDDNKVYMTSWSV
jgi:hypothetical protein